MANPYEEYTKSLYKKHGYFGTWAPGLPLKLGDVGILEGKYWFKRTTTLEKRGIAFEVRPDGTSDRLDFTSSSGVSIDFKAQGEVPSPGSRLQQSKAGIVVAFSRENGIVFRLQGCTFVSIEDEVAVGERILELLKAGKWNPQWVVVTQLCVADTATILMSKSSNAKIEIVAGTGIQDPTDDDLARADAELRIAFQSSMETSYVAQSGLTPLFLASRIRDDRFGPVPASLGVADILQRVTPAEISQDGRIFDRLALRKVGLDEVGEEAQVSNWQISEDTVEAAPAR